jgi:predicted nucleotidyltransferase
MRLTPAEVARIKAVVTRHFGEAALVRLFGSRVDDSRRGGDVDLVVETAEAWPADGSGLMRELRCQSELEAALGERSAGERRVDLVVQWARQETAPIVQVARAEGVVL